MVSDYKIIVDKKENVFVLLSLSLPLTTASMCMARPVIYVMLMSTASMA